MQITTGAGLSDYETQVLDRITTDCGTGRDGQWVAQAFIVYVDCDGRLQFGRCRGVRRPHGQEWFEVSPFPGAWEGVKRSQIVQVRKEI